MDGQISRPIILNGRVLDTNAGILRDASGAEITLRPQSYQVLRFLADNPNRIVGKAEVFDAVWPNTAVTENSLVQCIHEIRRALGDGNQVVLKTAARRGYQLVVSEGSGSAETASSATERLVEPVDRKRGKPFLPVLAAAVLMVSAFAVVAWKSVTDQSRMRPPSIAVLPFSYESDVPQRANFADGFTEDVITDLTRFRDLVVIAPSSIKKYGSENQDVAQAAKDLHVRYVLKGSIRRQNNHLRVTAHLIEASSGTQSWAEQWDRQLDDAFTIETDLANELAGKLGGYTGTVLVADKQAALRKRPGDMNAYELYLAGIDSKNRDDKSSISQAIDLLKQSIAIDPGFARAWTMLGSAYAMSLRWAKNPSETHRLYEEAVTKAVELDPLDAEAHSSLAFALALHLQPERSKAEFDAALRLNPNSADVLTRYAFWASVFGLPKEGGEMAARAFRLNPNPPLWAIRMMRSAFISADRNQEALTIHNLVAKEKYADTDYIEGTFLLGSSGRLDAAKSLASDGEKMLPDLTIES